MFSFRLRWKGQDIWKICTSLATALLNHMKGGRLDIFFELEEKIMGGIKLDKRIMEVLMLLFIIYFL